MGFFKELKESFKEGVEEGRQELEAEKTAGQDSLNDLLTRITYEEQFGVALAAPFRVSAFNDWFTIFKDEELTDDEFPRHLYAISETGLVQKADLKMLKKLLARDFDIRDGQSALWTVGQMFEAAAIPTQMEFPYDEDKEDTWAEWVDIIYNHRMLDEDGRKAALTLVVCMAAHAITASTDVGFIETRTALSLLSDLRVFTKSLYAITGSWSEYGTRFLAANNIFELNDEKGMSLLQGHVEHLLGKRGSPWVNVPFAIEGEEIIPFDEIVTLPEIMELYDEDEINSVEEHIKNSFGKFDNVMHEICSEDIHLDVAVVEPDEKLDRYVLVTLGAGAHMMDVPEELHDEDLYRMELLIVLPADWNIHGEDDKDFWPIGTLKGMARYPLIEETWIGHGHTVHFWEDEFAVTGFVGYLVSHPLIGSEGAHCCTLQSGSDVNFYQLIPLYEDEMDYKVEHGSDALIEKFFDAFGTDYDFAIDSGRKSVLIR